MAGSVTEIANRALDLIGHDQIGSIDEDTRTARLCARLYAIKRDETLRRHPWTFAKARAVLPALAAAPAWGFARAFQLPADYLRLIKLNVSDPRTPYQVEGDTLVTDAEAPLGILYIRRVDDVAAFDPIFETALAYALAGDMARPIANSGTMREEMVKSFEATLRDARSVNASEGTAQELWADDLLMARL